jgi:hypothetical protein
VDGQIVSIDVELISFITGLPSNGEKPMQYMDEKTKENGGNEKDLNRKGSQGIIIKQISDATTRMETKLMVCKLLWKCRKEEVPAGVVVATTQCTNDTMLSWAPYLLNLFLDNCKDVHDLGTEFHYSWLIVLIALIGWKEPTYSHFYDRVGQCRATRYKSLGSTSDRNEEVAMLAPFPGI